MTATQEQAIRERIAAMQLGYTEIWATVTAASRDLAKAIAEGNLDESYRQAAYIADVVRWLKSGGAA